MKTARKVLLLVLCAALLVSASVMGTMAYLTSTSSAQNTFTVGKVTIDLNETDVDEDDNTKQNDYHLMPGGEYTKDPVVTVKADSEESYVRMLVTVSNISDLKAAFSNNVAADGTFLLQNMVTGWDSTVWVYEACTENETDDTAVYEFRYVNKVAKPAVDTDLPALFQQVVIPETTTETQMAELTDGINIDIVAHAIQAEGFADAAAAWTAFDTQN